MSNLQIWHVTLIERRDSVVYPWRVVGLNKETGTRFDWTVPDLVAEQYDRPSVEAALEAMRLRDTGLVVPQLGLNGSGVQSQVEERCAAANAIDEAVRVLRQVEPHPRDYIGNSEGLKRDRALHTRRLNDLRLLGDRLRLEAETILTRAESARAH